MIKRNSNIIRYVCIFLCVILAASLVTQIELERSTPIVPSYENVDTPSTDDESETNVYVWCSLTSHPNHILRDLVYCSGCDLYLEEEDDLNMSFVESCGFAACYSNATCVVCNSPVEPETVVTTCCFVNGKCHVEGCNNVCDHVCDDYDYLYIGNVSGHPLSKVNFPFEIGDSYVVNGQCMLCFMTVT